MDIAERKRLKDEWRKEWIAELMEYKAGVMADGKRIVFAVPLDKVKEWVKK